MAKPLTSCLASIPVVDVREGGTLRHAQEDPKRARAMHDTIISWLPQFIRPLIPMLDRIARRWLVRSQYGGAVLAGFLGGVVDEGIGRFKRGRILRPLSSASDCTVLRLGAQSSP